MPYMDAIRLIPMKGRWCLWETPNPISVSIAYRMDQQSSCLATDSTPKQESMEPFSIV